MVLYSTMGTNQYVWNTWTTGSSNTIIVTGGDLIWNNWATNSTTTTASSLVWTNWQLPQYSRPITRPVEVSTEELARRAERQRRYEEEQQRIKVESAEAEVRATELLKVILSDEQWSAYETRKEFSVIGKSGRRYLIRHGTHGNVKAIEDEVVTESLCIQPPLSEPDDDGRYRQLPIADVLVAQVLGIRHDEDAFRRVANITRVTREGYHRAREALVI